MTRKFGTRHALLFYRRTMERVASLAFFLALVLLAFIVWSELQPPGPLGQAGALWLTAGCLVSTAIALFAFLSRWMAYTQAHQDYLRIVTPFLKLKVAYRRIRRIHPSLLQQIFPKETAGWAGANFLEPFYGKTVIVVEVNNYPVNPKLLRLFFSRYLFSPMAPGFVLLVPDWMKFSTEIDTLHGNWLQSQKMKQRIR